MPPEKHHDQEGGKVKVSQAFAATIRKRGPFARLVIESQDWYQTQLNKFRDGEAVTVVLTTKKLKRTTAQNNYYWGVYLPLIASETGETDVDRLHELFKGMFLTKEVVEVLGHKVRIKGSTTGLSISDFCHYIQRIEAETGVAAPPTESYGLPSLEEGKSSTGTPPADGGGLVE